MDFVLVYLFFGPIVAIPIGIMTLSWKEMLVQGFLAQLAELIFIHYALESLNYPIMHRKALLNKFANATNKKVSDIRHNTERLESRFYDEFGHFGYYLSLIFLAFTLGVTWSAIIAFALKLRMSVSAIFISIGSIMGFLFWYWAFKESVVYVAADLLAVLGFILSLTLLFYGDIREKHVMKLALTAIGKKRKKNKTKA